MERIMNRRRSQQAGLPLTNIDRNVPDGSGKAVRMDSPLLRSIKATSSFTKCTYVWLLFSLLSILWGWKMIRYRYASIDIICNSKKCTLKIYPPGNSQYYNVIFMRDQLLSSEVTFIDQQGHERRRQNADVSDEEKSKLIPPTTTTPDKPDTHGYYESFAVLVANHSSVEAIYNPNGHNTTIKEWERMIQAQYVTKEENGNYRIIVRRFNLGHTFKRVQSQMSKVYTYVKKRREQLHIEEPTNISWQGILLMTFGAMSTLISIALGQFSDDDDDEFYDYRRGVVTAGGKQQGKKNNKNINSTYTASQQHGGNTSTHTRGNNMKDGAVQNGLGSRHSFAYTYTGYPNMKNY